MTWKAALAVLLLGACGGKDGDDDTGVGSGPPFPDCVSIEADGVTQQLVRTFDASGHVVEETLDGAPHTTYTYDGDDLATKVTPDETWTFTWGPDGIASIDVTDAAGGELGEYVYFYEDRQLTDIAYRLPDGTTEQPLRLDWIDRYTSNWSGIAASFVSTTLAPPLSDPLRDPENLLMTDYYRVSDQDLFFERDVDADGLPTVERIYNHSVLLETRTWSYCGG